MSGPQRAARRVVVTQHVPAAAVDLLRGAGLDVLAREEDTPMTAAELRAAAADADGLVTLLTDRVDAALLAAAPRLSVVANVAVGFDNVDVPAATAAGVAVCNTPGVLDDATADLTMALLLATARRVPEADAFLRAGRYTHWKLEQEQLGSDVTGRRLGIFGLGKIGRAVARRASRGFDMDVVYVSGHRLPPDQEAELGVRWVEMDELLATSDFVSVHAPLTAQTHHAVDAAALARMKRTAILVNTSRGPVVDEAALAEALAAGTIAGAGLDVYEHEPSVHPGLLQQRERVVLLPHVGSATASTRSEMSRLAATSVLQVLAGERPGTLVNHAVLDEDGGLRPRTGAA